MPGAHEYACDCFSCNPWCVPCYDDEDYWQEHECQGLNDWDAHDQYRMIHDEVEVPEDIQYRIDMIAGLNDWEENWQPLCRYCMEDKVAT